MDSVDPGLDRFDVAIQRILVGARAAGQIASERNNAELERLDVELATERSRLDASELRWERRLNASSHRNSDARAMAAGVLADSQARRQLASDRASARLSAIKDQSKETIAAIVAAGDQQVALSEAESRSRLSQIDILKAEAEYEAARRANRFTKVDRILKGVSDAERLMDGTAALGNRLWNVWESVGDSLRTDDPQPSPLFQWSPYPDYDIGSKNPGF